MRYLACGRKSDHNQCSHWLITYTFLDWLSNQNYAKHYSNGFRAFSSKRNPMSCYYVSYQYILKA